MSEMVLFGDVLEAADHLSVDEQLSLIDILQQRLRERRRAEILKNIQEARQEFQQGRCQLGTPNDIMQDILS